MYRLDWDPTKNARNRTERGIDLEIARELFATPTAERPDTRRDYGELRIIAVGRAAGVFLTVVYTDRMAEDEDVRRIISLRRSSPRERRFFEETHGRDR